METIYIKCEPDCEEDLSDSIFNADAQVLKNTALRYWCQCRANTHADEI